MRRAVTVIVAVAIMLTLGLVRAASAPAAGSVTFHVYDSAGQRITWSAFRTLQENGKGTQRRPDLHVAGPSRDVCTARRRSSG